MWDKIILKGKVESDVSKAFTNSFNQINSIPLFNQFDIWRKYDNTVNIDEMHELTLYYIKLKVNKNVDDKTMQNIEYLKNGFCKYMKQNEFERFIEHKVLHNNKTCLMFNKTHNLVYGKFLKEFMNENNDSQFEILYYKTPSFIHKVDYKSINAELWKAVIDENDKELDTYIKKLIANINYGLLEKGGATNQKSILFKTLSEAVHYQTEYGGKIHRLAEFEGEEDDNYNRLNEKEKASYYILNLQDKAKLRNGYRYIKELLLQHHNFSMNSDFYKLILNNINIYSVKTDAFVIDECNVEKAKKY